MKDRDISAGCLVAYSLWIVALALLILSWVLACEQLGHAAMVAAAAAGTATIRQFFVDQNRYIREAFELGRDSVRPIR